MCWRRGVTNRKKSVDKEQNHHNNMSDRVEQALDEAPEEVFLKSDQMNI